MSRGMRKRTRRTAKAKTATAVGPTPDDPHEIAFFRRHPADDPLQAQPGQEFIRACPKAVRAKIYATLEAVAKAPPNKFAGGGRWEAMHGDMTGWFEDRCDGGDPRKHYRVFCLLDYAAPNTDRPRIVVVTGMAKPLRTTFTDSVYRSVRALGVEYVQHRTVG
ncbi:MAG: hypothetical protein KGP12_10030 [Actinomycetales bacterium]|nr:hypothetical protein [Actinomycetales bacterium]